MVSISPRTDFVWRAAIVKKSYKQIYKSKW